MTNVPANDPRRQQLVIRCNWSLIEHWALRHWSFGLHPYQPALGVVMRLKTLLASARGGCSRRMLRRRRNSWASGASMDLPPDLAATTSTVGLPLQTLRSSLRQTVLGLCSQPALARILPRFLTEPLARMTMSSRKVCPSMTTWPGEMREMVGNSGLGAARRKGFLPSDCCAAPRSPARRRCRPVRRRRPCLAASWPAADRTRRSAG